MIQPTEDGLRDAMALVAAMARQDTDGCDAILASADLPVMVPTLAMLIVGMLSEIGVEDVDAHVRAWQQELSARSAG